MSVPDSSLVADGRRRRSERTRLAIIEAYLELLRQNLQMPTAAHLADQAGCSVRSIFERFSDLNALRLAVADYAIAQGQAEAVARDFNGDRPARIQSHVETRGWPAKNGCPCGALSRARIRPPNSRGASSWCASPTSRE